MSNSERDNSHIPRPLRLIAMRMVLAALALSPTVACNSGSRQPVTEPTPISTPLISEADVTDISSRITMVAADIGNRQVKEVKDFLDRYAALVDTEEIIVTSDPVEINQDTASWKRFLQRSLISEKAGEPLYELENTYDERGILITASLKTERSNLNLPEINSAIDNVIATEGLLSPKLAGLYEQLLRSAFKLPGGTDCYSDIVNGSIRGWGGVAGVSTHCSVQIDKQNGTWNIVAHTQPNGGIEIEVYDVKTVSCGSGGSGS